LEPYLGIITVHRFVIVALVSFHCAKLISVKFWRVAASLRFRFVHTEILAGTVARSYLWYESYKAAVLETDWTDRRQAPQASAAKAILPVSYPLFTGLRTLNSVEYHF
jgi:hypothetical protein